MTGGAKLSWKEARSSSWVAAAFQSAHDVSASVSSTR